MMLLQAVQEAAKSTSRLYLDGVAIMALITSAAMVAREYFKSRRTKRNGNSNSLKPGVAPDCLKHRDALTRLDGEQKNTKEDITEMKSDIKELLRRVPPRD